MVSELGKSVTCEYDNITSTTTVRNKRGASLFNDAVLLFVLVPLFAHPDTYRILSSKCVCIFSKMTYHLDKFLVFKTSVHEKYAFIILKYFKSPSQLIP